MCGTILTCGILASYLVQTTTEVRGESDVPKNPQKYFTNKSVELLRQNWINFLNLQKKEKIVKFFIFFQKL